MKRNHGFTLLEILLVVGLIAILAGIVILALNPTKMFSQVRNAQRKANLTEINKAVYQYYIDNSRYPATLTSIATEICNTGATSTGHSISCTGLIDLSALVPTYMVAIPTDPSGAINTGGAGYKIASDPIGKPYLQASRAELSVSIYIGNSTGVLGTNWDMPGSWTTPTTTGNLRYWVASSAGSWNDTANWSTTSGGAGGSSVPGSTEDAYFDGSGNGACTINATVNVKGLILEGYSGTITQGSYAVTVGTDGYSQASGTFTGSGAGSAVTVNGIYKLAGGVFTGTSGTLTVAGNFTKTNGTFAHNSGTTKMTGYGSTFTSGGTTFGSLTFYSTAYTANPYVLADDFVVAGDLTISSAAYGWVTAISPRTITLQSNFYQTTSFNSALGGFDTSNITLIMTGSGKTFTLSSGQFKANLSLQGATTLAYSAYLPNYSGTLTIDASVGLGAALNCGSLVINSGKTLTTNNYDVTISGSLINSGTFTLGTSNVTLRNAYNSIVTHTTGGIAFNNLTLGGASASRTRPTVSRRGAG